MNAETGTDRVSFLTRVQAALAGTGEPTPRQVAGAAGDDWVARAESIRAEALRRWDELLPRFTEELEAVGGVVHRAYPAAIPAVVSGIAKARHLSRVVTWSEEALGVQSLLPDLQATGLEVMDGSAPHDPAGTPEAVEGIRGRLDRGEIGLTGVDLAVAECGSLLLLTGPGKGRLVSCLPIVHVAILRPGQLVESLEDIGVLLECMHRQSAPADSPSGITFITGPSRTADIELSLTRGVHGPKEVHVIALS